MSDTSLNKIIQYGTAAEMAAFTPTPAVGSQVLYIWMQTDNLPSTPDVYMWDGSTWVQTSGAAVGGITELTGDVTAGPGFGSQAATIANNAVTNAKFRESVALSVVGNPTNATTEVDDIAAATDNQVLRRSGTAIGFGAVNLASDDAVTGVLSSSHLPGTANPSNFIRNGNFNLAQRQVHTTVTTYSNTAARVFSFDGWGGTNENASFTAQGVVTSINTPETGLTSSAYGTFAKITSAGKLVISQCLEGGVCMCLRSRTIRVQVLLKASTATTMRIVLLQLQAAGTVDVIPGYTSGAPAGTFISAFNADATDPTFGTNLAKITPVDVDNATSANDGLTCSVTTSWQRFGGTFTLPSDFKNLVLVIFSDAGMAAADTFSITEVGLYDTLGFVNWIDPIVNAEVLRAQRYYTKSFGILTAPATAAGLNSAIRGHVSVAGATAGQPIGVRFPTLLRNTGLITSTFYNPSAANAQVRNTSNGVDQAGITAFANINAVGADITFTGQAGGLAGQAVAIHYSVDNEF